MKQICIFAYFGLNIHHSFDICYLERLCLYGKLWEIMGKKWEIMLAAPIRHNSKTNMTKNRDKSWYF